MSDDNDFKVRQMCLGLNAAALALFDQVEADGDDAPLSDPTQLFAVTAAFNAIRVYYQTRALRRLAHLDPAFLARIMSGDDS